MRIGGIILLLYHIILCWYGDANLPQLFTSTTNIFTLVNAQEQPHSNHYNSNSNHHDFNNNNINQNQNQNIHQNQQPPVVINKQREFIVGAGANISLPCSARGTPPLTFVWFQDDRNMTTGNQKDPPPSTKLLEEKRYEIAEIVEESSNITTSILHLIDLRVTDTSIFVCWVENGAGYTIVNYSLIVDSSLPVQPQHQSQSHQPHATPIGFLGNNGGGLFATGSTQAQAVLVGLLFLLILAAAIAILILVLKQRDSSKRRQHEHDLEANSTKGSMVATGGGAGSSRASDSDDASESGEDDYGFKDQTVMAGDYDGFIEHMRSGIINMDYHTMSPVMQFNTNSPKPLATII